MGNLWSRFLAGELKNPKIQISVHKPGVQEGVQPRGIQKGDQKIIRAVDFKADDVDGHKKFDEKGRVEKDFEKPNRNPKRGLV